MSKIINCLKLMAKVTNNSELAQKLDLNWLKMLELVGKINQIEAKLVNTNSGNSFTLTRNLNWLDERIIAKHLVIFGLTKYSVRIFPELNSTSTFILNNLGVLENNNVVTTELQSHGRGRGDNKWQSKMVTDLATSILYLFPSDFNFELLPLVTAVGVCRLLKQFRLKSYIKWPNDVYLDDQTKIAGVLLESGMRDGKRFVVLGVGLNNPQGIERNLLLSSLINHMDHVINEYKAFGFAMFRQEWLDNCIHLNQMVNIYQDGSLIDRGVNVDLTQDGQLVIQGKEKINKYMNNNVSLRFSDQKIK